MNKRSHKTISIDNLEYLPYKYNIKLDKRILLPKINREYKIKNNIKISKILFANNNKNNNNRKSKSTKNDLYLTISREENNDNKENLDLIENNENKLIKKLLNNKITISNNSSYKDKRRKLFKRNIILKKYMNEAILYRKSIFQKNQITLGKIFKPFSFEENNIVEFTINKKSMESTIHNKKERPIKRIKKFKTLDKNVELKKTIEDFKPSLRKKLHCNLKYNFNKNQIKINEINSEINDIESKIKFTFDGYRKDTNDIIHKVYKHTGDIYSL
jgi:hypothetical protein